MEMAPASRGISNNMRRQDSAMIFDGPVKIQYLTGSSGLPHKNPTKVEAEEASNLSRIFKYTTLVYRIKEVRAVALILNQNAEIMVTILNNEQYDFQPRAGRSYSVGWKVIWTYFVELLVVGIVYAVLSGPVSVFQWQVDKFAWFLVPLAMFGIAYGVFVAGPIGYGANWVFLKAVRGERIEIRDMFVVFQKNYWNAVIANIVVGVIVGLGIVMLIVPGIIFACRLAFVPYLVVDREMDVMDALRVSWDMTRGHGWQIFFMGLLTIPVVIGGLLCLGVGIIISIMWIAAAFAAMYHAVELKDGIPEIRYTGE